LVYGNSGRNWSLQFQLVGVRGNMFDAAVKITKSIFDVEDGLQIANINCWIF
jgi:hypothetical protein